MTTRNPNKKRELTALELSQSCRKLLKKWKRVSGTHTNFIEQSTQFADKNPRLFLDFLVSRDATPTAKQFKLKI